MSKPLPSQAFIQETREFASFSPQAMTFLALRLDKEYDFFNYDKAQVYRSAVIKEALAQGVDAHDTKRFDAFTGALTGFTITELNISKIFSKDDKADAQLDSFSSYRYMMERLFGAEIRPYLPGAFCGAAAHPLVDADRRKDLLQTLSENAATAPGWSHAEPVFRPVAAIVYDKNKPS